MTLAEAEPPASALCFVTEGEAKTGDMLRLKYTIGINSIVSYHLNYNRVEIIYIRLWVW